MLAAREAMANAAKFSGADEISVYAEADDARVSVFVRDRGAGFDRAVGAGRPPRPRRVDRGPDGARRRQRPSIASTPGEGTEVELTLPLAAEERGMKPRVVLVDDHELFRAGVRGELGDEGRDRRRGRLGRRGGAADQGDRSRTSCCSTCTCPDGGGEAVIAGVSVERPGVKFLALSVSDAAEDVIGVIRAGARGYVTKTISADELADAVRRVADGDAVFSPRLAGFVLDAFRAGERVHSDTELDELTAREREVLQLIARGYRYKEIAARLHLSVKTVESHVSNVLRKLQLSSRHELTRWAAERRLI